VADQSATGEIVFRTADTGIDGKTPVDLGDLDVVCIDALPSWVWYQEMPDFAEVVTGERAGRQLARAIQGREPSAGSMTSSTRRIRARCRRGTPSAMPAPGAVPSGGWRQLAH
jgi:hypothetical protein